MKKLFLCGRSEAGCEGVFCVNNLNGEGVDELVEYLNEKAEAQSLEESKEESGKGLKDWA